LEEILLGRSDRPVAQALGIVPGEDDLHGAKKPPVELRLLIGEQLPDAVVLKALHGSCSASSPVLQRLSLKGGLATT
jgi:hypothetical protein